MVLVVPSQQSAGAWLVDHIPEGTDLSVAIRVGNCEVVLCD